MLLRRWKFPPEIINPIYYHHETDLPDEVRAVDIALLRIANSLAQELALGEEGNSIPNKIQEKDLKLLKMKEKELEDMRAYSHSIKDKIYDLFNAMI